MAGLTDEKLMQRAFDLLDPLVREGLALHTVNDTADRTTLFFDNGVSAYFKRSEYFVSGYKPRDPSRLYAACEETGRVGCMEVDRRRQAHSCYRGTREADQPTPHIRRSHKGSARRVSRAKCVSVGRWSVSALGRRLRRCYERFTVCVRVESERIPFAVGDVFVNRGGIGPTLCICTQTESKPVVAFKIDQDILDREEMAINVI